MKITRTVRKTPKGTEVETFVFRIPKEVLNESKIGVGDCLLAVPKQGAIEIRRVKK